MTHDEHHRALVMRLASELRPVHRLWPASLRLALWIALEGVVLAWVIAHARNDFLFKLSRPPYVLECVFFGAAAILSAGLALKSAIPGRVIRPAEALLCLVLVLGGIAVVVVSQPLGINDRLGEFIKTGIPCAYLTAMLAALPWLVLWWAVKRGAPLRGGISGLWIGAGALFFAFAMMRIACPIDDPLHLITWHFLPTVMWITLSALAGSAWLGLRARFRQRDRAA